MSEIDPGDPIEAAASALARALRAELRTVPEESIDRALARSLSLETTEIRHLAGPLLAVDAAADESETDLAARLREMPAFRSLVRAHGPSLVRPRAFLVEPPPAPDLRWSLPRTPRLATPGDLADWLGLRPAELDWLAGRCRDHSARPESWRHYHCRWIPKRRGPDRLIESPKPFLKSIQRILLRDLVAAIPVHEAAHGFRPGRSIRTFAEPHAGHPLVLRLDLRQFFPSIRQPRVASLFRRMGYPDEVAALLAALCCHRTPLPVLESAPGRRLSWETRRRLRLPHLPQGAPTSPALSNAIAYRLDRRLTGLAHAVGARYTRYADDLAFSGDASEFVHGGARFARHVAAIVLEEGFACEHHKTQLMRAHQRQRIAGVVVNVRPNAARATWDELRAILHRCESRGIDAALGTDETEPEFLRRLQGRIAAFNQLNPDRGKRLRARFEALAPSP